MTGYLLPTDDEFVNQIAKTIARTRWEREAGAYLKAEMGETLDIVPPEELDAALERVFSGLWNGTTKNDEEQRNNYRSEALAAISAINLKLLTLSE